MLDKEKIAFLKFDAAEVVEVGQHSGSKLQAKILPLLAGSAVFVLPQSNNNCLEKGVAYVS